MSKVFWNSHSKLYSSFIRLYASSGMQSINALCLRLFATTVASTFIRSRSHPPPIFVLQFQYFYNSFTESHLCLERDFSFLSDDFPVQQNQRDRPLETSWYTSYWSAFRWYPDAVDFGSAGEVLSQDPVLCTVLLFIVSIHLSVMMIDWWHSLQDVHTLHIENCFFLHLFHAGFIMMDEIPVFQLVTVCDLEWVGNGLIVSVSWWICDVPPKCDVIFLLDHVSCVVLTLLCTLLIHLVVMLIHIVVIFPVGATLSNTDSSSPREDYDDWSWLGSRVSGRVLKSSSLSSCAS